MIRIPTEGLHYIYEIVPPDTTDETSMVRDEMMRHIAQARYMRPVLQEIELTTDTINIGNLLFSDAELEPYYEEEDGIVEDEAINLLTAGQDAAITHPPPARSRLEDMKVEAKSLHSALSEMSILLAEVLVDLDSNHMLHAELTVSLEETKELLAKCSPEIVAPRQRRTPPSPWGNTTRNVE